MPQNLFSANSRAINLREMWIEFEMSLIAQHQTGIGIVQDERVRDGLNCVFKLLFAFPEILGRWILGFFVELTRHCPGDSRNSLFGGIYYSFPSN